MLGEEALLLAEAEDEPRRVVVHGGAILASASDGKRIVTGGDDGKVIDDRRQGEAATLATDAKHRWIDQVALGPDGAVAWSAGKIAFVQAKELRELEAPSTVGGLAFLPKGFRLAIAHYNGATLWFPNAPQAEPERLEWKGSHLGATLQPRRPLPDHLACRSRCCTAGGSPIASTCACRVMRRASPRSAGPRAATCSPPPARAAHPVAVQTKDGPMGKQPQLLAPSEHRVEAVACHPKQDIVAAGYADGMVLLVRVEDGAEILAKTAG